MRKLLFCLMLCVGWIATVAVSAEPRNADEAMKVKLTRPAVSSTFKDALAKVAKLAKVRIVTDWPSIEATGVKNDAKVTVKCPKATGGQLLDLVLAQVSAKGKPLAWCTVDKTVFVTTQTRVLRRNRLPFAARKATTQHRKIAGRIAKLTFDKIALEKVIKFFRGVSGANIHVNWKSLQVSGIERDTEIELDVANVTIARALDLVLDQISANKDKYESVYWVVDRGVVTIATGTALDTKLQVRTYDVADLLMVIPNFVGPRMDVGNANGSGNTGNNNTNQNWQWDNDSDSKDGKNKEETIAEQRKKVRENLIGIIQDAIGKDMWQPQGKGSIRIFQKRLVISQTKLGFKLMEEASKP